MKAKTFAFFLILIGSMSAALGQPLVLETAYNPANGHTYQLLESSDWVSAESAAISLGGHLVTINDQAENDWLWNIWGTTRSLMIGATDAASEGTFVWTSGEAFSFSNWTAGEPNNGVGYDQEPENYSYMYADGWGTPGEWNDSKGIYVGPQPALQGVVETPEPSALSLILLAGVSSWLLRVNLFANRPGQKADSDCF